MSVRAAILILVFAVSSAWAAQPLEGLGAQIARWLETGHRDEVERAVAGFEEHPVPDSPARRALVEAFVGALTAHGEDALARRVLEAPAAPPAQRTDFGPLAFPKDDGVHKNCFAEWWYFNGNLEANGRRFGYELTFFRTAVNVLFVHAALSDVDGGRHPFVRRYVWPGEVSLGKGRLDVRYGPRWAARDDGQAWTVTFDTGAETVELTLTPERAPMIVNGDGIIKMPEGGLSRYYSRTRMATRGRIVAPDGQATAVTGRSWFDHQWGNFIVLFRPWDWFSFQMEDGSDYNLFSFREHTGHASYACTNTLSSRGALGVGTQMALTRDAWWTSPRTGNRFVTGWTIGLADRGETFRVTTPLADQEMPRAGPQDIPPHYWEGTVTVERRDATGRVTRGIGYCEHMPYGALDADDARPWRERAP